jgi:hypothetical protein
MVNRHGSMNQTTRRALSAVVATPCLLFAAYLTFDWADYDEDSTCGNFIRRAPWTGPCSEIMWHRVFAVIGLVAFAGTVVLLSWRRARPDPRSNGTAGCGRRRRRVADN